MARRIFFLILILIVYGSLFPWHFEPHVLPLGPFLYLLQHLDSFQQNSYLIHDILSNIALYIPFGLTARLMFEERHSRGFSIFAAVSLAAILSTCVELAQIYEPLRRPSVPDILSDIAGAAIGAALAGIARFARRTADPAASALLIGWGVWLLFPFYPSLSRMAFERRVLLFDHALLGPGPLLDWNSVVSVAAVWFAAGLLMRAAGIRAVRFWLAMVVLAIPAQFFILDRQPTPSEYLGAAAGFVLYCLYPRVNRTSAALFLAALALHETSRLPFPLKPSRFSFLPFDALITVIPAQTSLAVLVGKLCFYGSAFWLLRANRLGVVRAFAILLAFAGVLQITLIAKPDRLAGVTDLLVASIACFVIDAIQAASPTLLENSGLSSKIQSGTEPAPYHD